jgi:hypothetical protein
LRVVWVEKCALWYFLYATATALHDMDAADNIRKLVKKSTGSSRRHKDGD